MLIKRRSVLVAASLAATPIPAWARSFARGAFTHGIASGDPLPDGVVIWTRFVGEDDGAIGWEVAEDENFQRVTRRGAIVANTATDYCVKVDVRGLSAGRPYFYRFLSAAGPSPTGCTRTAPSGHAERVSFALFSCSNYPYGYFHAYRHAARRDDIDLALHVGDYIYEVQSGVFPGANEAVAGRVLHPETETVSLADYYQRYAAYHTDPDLLELRRLKPMAVVWDDHELANNAWHDGAQTHRLATQGPWSDRVAAASKAYFDWMPIRRPDHRQPRIYRSFDWGDLARFVMLDTRLIGRSKQIDQRTTILPAMTAPGANAAAVAQRFRSDVLNDPTRSMMGATQEKWFADTLAQSKRAGQPWQVVAQQVVMAEQLAPRGFSQLLSAGAPAITRQYFAAAEQLGALGLPWNMDSWNGYPAARARFLAVCTANANNALVLSGDSHNCWVNNLAAEGGARLAAIEFAGGSVTSPGFERSLPNAQPGQRERMMKDANANIAWCDATRRGYGAIVLTHRSCDAEWIGFDSVAQQTAPAPLATRLQSAPSMAAGPGAWAVAT